MKAGDIYLAMSIFGELLENDLPINTAIKLIKIEEEVSRVYGIIDNKRKEIVAEFGDESGIIPEGEVATANAAFEAILEEDVEFNIEDKIRLPDSVIISANKLKKVMWCVDV